MAVLSYALFWIPVVLSVIVLRRKLPDAPRPYRVLGYPFVPIIFVLVMCWIVINAFITSPIESVATLVLILIGLPLYPLFHGKSNRSKTSPAPEPSS
jgi:APA family basic amino acid/polyamine antiporter